LFKKGFVYKKDLLMNYMRERCFKNLQ